MLNNIPRFAASHSVSFAAIYGDSVLENWGIDAVCDWGIAIFIWSLQALLSVCGLTGISRNVHCVVELKLQLYLLSLRKSEPLGDNDQIPLLLISLIFHSPGSLTPDVSVKVFTCPDVGSGYSHLNLIFHSSSHEHLYMMSVQKHIRILLQRRLVRNSQQKLY